MTRRSLLQAPTLASQPPSPSYVPSDQTKLRRWYAALAAREATPAQIAIVGDSIFSGYGASALQRRNQTLLQRQLRRRFDITYGADYPFIPAYPAMTAPVMPVVRSGTVNANGSFGLAGQTGVMPDATGSITFTFTGTRAKVMFTKASGAAIARIVVDGGTAATIDTFNAATVSGGVLYDTGALTAGTHTVVVSRDTSSTAGRSLYCEGLLTWNGDENSGIRVIDVCHFGTGSGNQITANNGQSLAAAGGAGLAIYALGTNDYNATPIATFKSNVAATISQLRSNGFNGSVLYLGMYRGGGRTDALWDPLLQQLSDLAAADADGVFLNLRTRMPDAPPGGTGASGLGLFSDSLHPTDAGHGYLADVLAQFITPH